ncbi:MAG: cyanophycin synthetase [Patescibacteria group bacterium]|nr:cyanophycin synthetase [Patescibacteria group bacterium]
MIKRKRQPPFMGLLLKMLAPKIGAKVILEPKWGFVGCIIYKNGRRRYFRYSSLDLNPLGATEIATDKDYANCFLKLAGYPTVPGEAFYSDAWCAAIGSRRDSSAAYRYARRLGWPVIVKPNSGSQGQDVALVHNRAEFEQAMGRVFRRDRISLVQRQVLGNDYRLVVLDGRVISAYRRIPLNVVGDGRLSIRRLLERKQALFVSSGRDTQIKTNDPRIAAKLARNGRSLFSVPKRGETVFLLDNANLSTGGDAEDVTRRLHPAFRQLAVAITKDMGLRLCGVDLMIDGDIHDPPRRYWVLEINAAPGLDHYATTGRAQKRLVEDMYLKVLEAMQ